MWFDKKETRRTIINEVIVKGKKEHKDLLDNSTLKYLYCTQVEKDKEMLKEVVSDKDGVDIVKEMINFVEEDYWKDIFRR